LPDYSAKNEPNLILLSRIESKLSLKFKWVAKKVS